MNKKKLALLMAMCICLTATACGSVDNDDDDSSRRKRKDSSVVDDLSEEEGKNDTASVPIEQPEESSEAGGDTAWSSIAEAVPGEPEDALLPDGIESIPDGADGTLVYMTDGSSLENSADPARQLFESCGGTIEFKYIDYTGRYDAIAAAFLSDVQVDIVDFDDYAFPNYVVKGLYQPVDDIIDFSKPMWAETRDTAEMYAVNGNHFVAPLCVYPQALAAYRYDVIENEGLDDPYELYLNGEWDLDTFAAMVEEFCGSESGRTGISGSFDTAIIMQTGKGFVSFDNGRLINNMNDPDIERVVDLLFGMADSGYVNKQFYTNANEALADGNVLFYCNGPWTMTYTATLDDPGYGIVPVPRDPNTDEYYNFSSVNAYMWLACSEKAETVRTFMECARYCEYDSSIKELRKEEFMDFNPNWTEEMYEVYEESCGFSRPAAVNYLFGLAPYMDEIRYMGDSYADAPLSGYMDSGITWEETRDYYLPIIDDLLNEFNSRLADL